MFFFNNYTKKLAKSPNTVAEGFIRKDIRPRTCASDVLKTCVSSDVSLICLLPQINSCFFADTPV